MGFFREGVSSRVVGSKADTSGMQSKKKGSIRNNTSKGRNKLANAVNRDNIKVYYCNSRSVRNKIDLLRGLASVERPEVIAITETWIDTEGRDFKSEFEIEGYNVFHKDRKGRTGGGVAIYVDDSLNSFISSTVETGVNNESLWIEIVNGRDRLLIGCIYRPPSLSREETSLIYQEISAAATRYNNVCIMGDFNFRGIDWVNNVGRTREEEEFLDVINDNFLRQLVNVPTRENNILDLVLTNRDDLVNNLEVGGRLGNSDHEELRFNIMLSCKKNNVNRALVPDFRRGSYESLRKHLEEANNLRIRKAEVARVGIRESQDRADRSGEVAGRGGVEGDYNEFVRMMREGQERHIPHREIRSGRNDPKWMTSRLKRLIGIKRGVYKRIRDGGVELRDRYTLLARTIKKDIRKAKRDYEIRVARDRNDTFRIERYGQVGMT